MREVIEAKVEDIEKVRTLFPKILKECRDYLATTIPLNLTYSDIPRFYSELNGDLDHCRGHYQVNVRTQGRELDAGKIFFSFLQPKSEFQVCVDSQQSGGGAGVHEIVGKIKKILDEEKVSYS